MCEDNPKETKLRVLMISRATLFSHPGGDTIQIRKTAEYLNKIRGINVDVKTVVDTLDYTKYDLLHLFNICRPADLLGVIKKSKLPYVVSTVFVDFTEAEANHPEWIRRFLNSILKTNGTEYIKTIARVLKGQDKLTDYSYLIKGQKNAIVEIIKNAKILLPNSKSEYNRLLKAYGVEQKFRVIPNAIDTDVFSLGELESNAYNKFENAVISVGQITPVKNQLNLVKALRNTKYKVFIIGAPSSNGQKYFNKCKKEASNNIHFIPFVEQEELVQIYKKAKVHVLCSWFETTGLVSLESAYMGCNIVITNRGDQVEYFKEGAFYCQPDDLDSILSAVDEAHKSQFKNELRGEIELRYRWQITAEKTRQVYQTLFKKGGST